jgi:pyruvate-formate lyase-activating enzyme
MDPILSPARLYRLPWNLADNVINWLEPTSACNLACDGCYRDNRPNAHKSLDEIRHELDVFARMRRTDSVSITGGEPLAHPQIVDVVRLVKEKRWKPMINSNGALLTPELLRELKKAGLTGFTFHVDSGQNRPGWKNATEADLNAYRYELARLVADARGISVNFNATVYPETMEQMPAVLGWAREHIDIVHGVVFILYRMAVLGQGYDTWVGGERVEFGDMAYATSDAARRTTVTSPEMVERFRREEPGLMPCAFLNGTENVDSYKWLLSERVANSRATFGYVGPKFMELIQAGHHVFTGSYLAYTSPPVRRRARMGFLLAPFDRGMRRAMGRYLASFVTNPRAFWKRVHFQTVLIIQPADLMPSGAVNMCDGCPDITVWNDTLVWSCRMEEQMRWGQNIRLAPITKRDGA